MRFKQNLQSVGVNTVVRVKCRSTHRGRHTTENHIIYLMGCTNHSKLALRCI